MATCIFVATPKFDYGDSGVGVSIVIVSICRVLVRFHNFEEASLFVAAKRADGYFAEVIHQNAGHFYGHMAVNGFAVIVSEEEAPEEVEVPVPPVTPISEIKKMVAMFGLLGGVGFLAAVLFLLALAGWAFLLAPLVLKVQVLLFLAIQFVGMYGMLKLTRIYNRPGHPLYMRSRTLMNGIVWVILFPFIPELITIGLGLIFGV